MFGRKKQKVDPVEQIEKAIDDLEQFVSNAEYKRKSLLDKAKTAKGRGDKASYNMAVNALKMIMGQQKRAEQMSLTLSVCLDIKDINNLSTTFMSSMELACKNMSFMPNFSKLSKVAGEMGKNMQKMNTQAMMFDEYMSAMAESMGDMELNEVDMSDDIGRAIERELAADLSDDDVAFSKELELAKKTIND